MSGRREMHASLTQPMVDKLIEMTADSYHCGFEAARSSIAARWAEFAREADGKGLSTWQMWAEMAVMARRAVDPRIA